MNDHKLGALKQQKRVLSQSGGQESQTKCGQGWPFLAALSEKLSTATTPPTPTPEHT